MSCFDNEYKLNREDEDYFPQGETTMANIYSDGPEDELDEIFEDFPEDFYLEDDEEDEEFEDSELEFYRGLD